VLVRVGRLEGSLDGAAGHTSRQRAYPFGPSRGPPSGQEQTTGLGSRAASVAIGLTRGGFVRRAGD
jgi:hypothetical protein